MMRSQIRSSRCVPFQHRRKKMDENLKTEASQKENKIYAIHIPKKNALGQRKTSQSKDPNRRRMMTRHAIKSIVILAYSTLALQQVDADDIFSCSYRSYSDHRCHIRLQVKLLFEEYLSFPTNTLYVINEAMYHTLPGITICPNLSLKVDF